MITNVTYLQQPMKQMFTYSTSAFTLQWAGNTLSKSWRWWLAFEVNVVPSNHFFGQNHPWYWLQFRKICDAIHNAAENLGYQPMVAICDWYFACWCIFRDHTCLERMDDPSEACGSPTREHRWARLRWWPKSIKSTKLKTLRYQTSFNYPSSKTLSDFKHWKASARRACLVFVSLPMSGRTHRCEIHKESLPVFH